jgi:putative ATP-dependent endonuclease of OLD family
LAKKSNVVETIAACDDSTTAVPRPRLSKLTVRNFRAIGGNRVSVELDDIVVLVGPNNSGKSSILRAYEVVMQQGSKSGELTLQDFPNGHIDSQNPVEIELETVVFDEKAPGEKWIKKDETTGEMLVREKWSWTEIGKPKKVGWDWASNDWDSSQGPWGAANVAQAGRPEPHHIDAFAEPEKQAEEVVKLLKDILNDRIKTLQSEAVEDGEEKNEYGKLVDAIAAFQEKAVEQANEQIEQVEKDLNELIGKVFPGQEVRFDAKPDSKVESALNFFKDTPELRMGPVDGYQPTIDRQGSGARRTLLWAALRLVAEQTRKKKDSGNDRSHVLLIDEPELCLHPDAIREACKVLYDLPSTGRWQVMVTTHSPVFIDMSRKNTSIVRVSRRENGDASGTTIYRPSKADLGDDDEENLKLLNLCDPYVAEFFFGGRTIVVEGDTEYTAFKYLIQQQPEDFKDIHILRARGKATIRSLCKILNQFGTPFAVLHDSDTPTAQRKVNGQMTTIVNPAWTMNREIRKTVEKQIEQQSVYLVASVPNFEQAYMDETLTKDKPIETWKKMKSDTDFYQKMSGLLKALCRTGNDLPPGAIAWKDETELQQAFEARGSATA